MDLPKPPGFALEASDEGSVLRLNGDWTVATLHEVDAGLRALRSATPLGLDVTALGRIDTAGAFVIDRTLRSCNSWPVRLIGDHPAAASLLAQVHFTDVPAAAPVAVEGRGWVGALESIGRGAVDISRETLATLAFLGETLATLARLLLRPWSLRWTSVVSVMQEAGLNAVPIVAFLTFFVGMVVAFIGATTLSDFDLEIYTIELVGYSMLREFGVVLTGIVLAGRTNSSFTAQIGTMKMRQEIDAMQTLGLKAMDVIVVPRVIAMIVMTPVLAFIATLAGIAGGIVVGWTSLDITPAVFIERLRAVPLDQFWIGMSKAPVFGLVIALIACRQGLKVGGSVQSLGHATTTSVVQAIFSIIVIDALFAIFYMQLGI